MTVELDRAKFREWLAGFDPDTGIGRPGIEDCCPLAEYFVDLVAPEHPRIWVGGEVVVIGDHEQPLPRWAQSFTGQIDWIPGEDVTAGEALAILDDIPQEVAA